LRGLSFHAAEGAERRKIMEFEWLPKGLTTRCNALVAAHHKTYGGSVPKIVGHRDTLVIILTHEDLRTLLGSATALWKMSVVLGVVAVFAFVLAAVLNWWIALALIPTVSGMIYFYKLGANSYTLIAAIILAFEMLADDFAGWGTRFPDAVHQTRKIFTETEQNNLTRLLDIYLPSRAHLDPALLQQFGPSNIAPFVLKP
jgi:hypothetical protein